MMVDIFVCGRRKREPCLTEGCGRASIAGCHFPIKFIRREGKLVPAPDGATCGRPVCHHCATKVDRLVLCLGHARMMGKEGA